jgi:hypothetical protein
MGYALRRVLIASGVAGLCLGCASVTPPATPPATPAPVTTGPATIVMQQTPAASPECGCSLPKLLGLDKAFGAGQSLVNCIRNQLGTRFPGLEAKPALTAIADPANLKSANPAVASAAAVKADEDAAPQKIKALNYLAKVGCTSCYPDVEKAFLAGLDDCTEAVRFAAADNLRDAAGCPCQCCRQKSCCSAAIRKKLKDVGYGVDEKTKCPKESSPRVRRAARLALERCGCPPCENSSDKQTLPAEGPGAKDLPTAGQKTAPPPGPPTPTPAGSAPVTP